MITVHIDQEVHELMVVALSRLAMERPGWMYACKNAASSISGAYKFDELVQTYQLDERRLLDAQFNFLEVQNADDDSGGDSGQGGPAAVAGARGPYHPCG